MKKQLILQLSSQVPEHATNMLTRAKTVSELSELNEETKRLMFEQWDNFNENLYNLIKEIKTK